MYQFLSKLNGAAGLLLQFSPSLASAAPTWHPVTPPGTQSLHLALSHSVSHLSILTACNSTLLCRSVAG